MKKLNASIASLALALAVSHVVNSNKISSLELSRDLYRDGLEKALTAQREGVSRQNNKVMGLTIGLQDRQARVEQLEAECRLQVSALSSRLDALEKPISPPPPVVEVKKASRK